MTFRAIPTNRLLPQPQQQRQVVTMQFDYSDGHSVVVRYYVGDQAAASQAVVKMMRKMYDAECRGR